MIKVGDDVYYVLSKHSDNAGLSRPAKVLHIREDASVNLLVDIQEDDFDRARYSDGVIDYGDIVDRKPVRVKHSKIDPETGYYYVNGVYHGTDEDNWYE